MCMYTAAHLHHTASSKLSLNRNQLHLKVQGSIGWDSEQMLRKQKCQNRGQILLLRCFQLLSNNVLLR